MWINLNVKLLSNTLNRLQSTKQQPLPPDFETTPNLLYEEDQKSSILSTARHLIIPKSFAEEQGIACYNADMMDMPTWSGANALTSTDTIMLKKEAFLPVIPHPVTKHETVYTCLANL